MEGQLFCGSEDVDPIMLGELEENRAEVEPAVPFLIEQLSKALNVGTLSIEEKEEALKNFRQILSFLELPRKDPPETISSTSVNENGSVIQDAVRGGKTDFVRLLLEHGVDPTVGTDTVKETPIELAANMESTELLTLFAEFVDLPPEIKIKLN